MRSWLFAMLAPLLLLAPAVAGAGPKTTIDHKPLVNAERWKTCAKSFRACRAKCKTTKSFNDLGTCAHEAACWRTYDACRKAVTQ